MGVDCYIINTGFFLDKKVTPAITLGSIEEIVLDKAKFEAFGPFSELQYLPIEGFNPDFNDKTYLQNVKARMKDRLDYVSDLGDFDKLPDEALNALKKVVNEI